MPTDLQDSLVAAATEDGDRRIDATDGAEPSCSGPVDLAPGDFQPRQSLLRFQSSPFTDAFRWLETLQGKEPWSDLRQAYALAAWPEPVAPAVNPAALPFGPIRGRGTCPVTGRALTLRVWRDLSAVILREGLPGSGAACEVLPASFALINQAFDQSLKDVPLNLRGKIVPRLSFQARPDGIWWARANSLATEEEILSLLEAAIESRAGQVLAGGPVADPRAHPNPPEGARFAPHARWPRVDAESPEIAALTLAIRAMASLHLHNHGDPEIAVSIGRSAPGEPWRMGKSPEIRAGAAGRSDKAFRKQLRLLLEDPRTGIPVALRQGSGKLVDLWTIVRPASAHAAIAQSRILAVEPWRCILSEIAG